MNIVSELACILFVFVQKMLGIFLAGGEYRVVFFFLVVVYVIPLTSLVVVKELCRLLTSLVVVKECVLVASKIRRISKRVKRWPDFWLRGSEEICLVLISAILFLWRNFSLKFFFKFLPVSVVVHKIWIGYSKNLHVFAALISQVLAPQ